MAGATPARSLWTSLSRYCFNNQRGRGGAKEKAKIFDKQTLPIMTTKPHLTFENNNRKGWKTLALPPFTGLVERYLKKGSQPLVLFSVDQPGALRPGQQESAIILRQQLNCLREIDANLIQLNAHIREGGYLFGCVETIQLRKKRIMSAAFWPLNRLLYGAEVLLKRMGSRFPVLRPYYFRPEAGRSWALWEMEVLGRLCACGYYPEETVEEGGLLYFCARRIALPEQMPRACCGLVIRLPRVGKEGRPFNILKFRTMYPYSEYLQEYIFNNNGLQTGGKFRNDPRITYTGRFMRRYWLDEVPNLINLFRREIKLFGLRPISSHYLSLYPEYFQQLRKRFKPGMIPPEYVDMPKTMEDIVASEMRYMEAYERRPFLTDLRYTLKALYNIVIKRVRSH